MISDNNIPKINNLITVINVINKLEYSFGWYMPKKIEGAFNIDLRVLPLE